MKSGESSSPESRGENQPSADEVLHDVGTRYTDALRKLEDVKRHSGGDEDSLQAEQAAQAAVDEIEAEYVRFGGQAIFDIEDQIDKKGETPVRRDKLDQAKQIYLDNYLALNDDVSEEKVEDRIRELRDEEERLSQEINATPSGVPVDGPMALKARKAVIVDAIEQLSQLRGDTPEPESEPKLETEQKMSHEDKIARLAELRRMASSENSDDIRNNTAKGAAIKREIRQLQQEVEPNATNPVDSAKPLPIESSASNPLTNAKPLRPESASKPKGTENKGHGEKSVDSKDKKKSLDKLLEDFKSSENISDEEMKKFRKLIELMVQAGMVNSPENKEGEQKTETAEEKADREYKEKLEAVTKEVEEQYKTKREADLSRYGKAKADYDLAGHWGSKRRKEALGKAEKELYDNRVAEIRALIEAKKKAGLYEGTPEQEELEFMMELSRLDGELQKANIDEINKRFSSEEEYKKNFNWFQRRSMGLAKFFNKGSKFVRAAKNAAGGLAVGGATGAVIGVVGVGFPVTLAAAGVIAGARFSATTGARLDTLRGAYAGMKVEQQKELSSEQAAQLLEQMKNKYGKDGGALDGYAKEQFEKQQQRGDTERKKAIGRASWNAAWFSAGAAVGTLGGNVLGGVAHDAISAPRGVVGRVGVNADSIKDVFPGANGGETTVTPEYSYANYNTNGAPEHLFQKLTGTSGARSEQLFHALAKEVGGYDNLFVDGSGSPVDLKDYGGSIDIGFTGWDQDGSARLSDPLRAALERRGMSVGEDLPTPRVGGRR